MWILTEKDKFFCSYEVGFDFGHSDARPVEFASGDLGVFAWLALFVWAFVKLSAESWCKTL